MNQKPLGFMPFHHIQRVSIATGSRAFRSDDQAVTTKRTRSSSDICRSIGENFTPERWVREACSGGGGGTHACSSSIQYSRRHIARMTGCHAGVGALNPPRHTHGSKRGSSQRAHLSRSAAACRRSATSAARFIHAVPSRSLAHWDHACMHLSADDAYSNLRGIFDVVVFTACTYVALDGRWCLKVRPKDDELFPCGVVSCLWSTALQNFVIFGWQLSISVYVNYSTVGCNKDIIFVIKQNWFLKSSYNRMSVHRSILSTPSLRKKIPT